MLVRAKVRAILNIIANTVSTRECRAMSAAGIIPYYPGQTLALPSAVQWIEAVLLGQVGTTIAILAIAGVGFAMLQGQIALRQGIRVVLGCFILFGAPLIAQGLAGMARGVAEPPPVAIAPPPAPITIPTPPPPNPDPYAGASVPM